MTGPVTPQKYLVSPYKLARLEDKFLVTTDAGGWAILDKNQLELFQSGRADDDVALFAILENAGIINQTENILNETDRIKKRLWYLSNGPSLHVVAVTNVCNFACKYCYAESSDKTKMSEETAKKTVDFIMKSPAKAIVVEFSGGEPLLNFPAIKTVVLETREKAKRAQKNLGFAMIHNGSKWDEEKAKFFIDHNIGICFSLDGPRDLHNMHRPYRTGGGTYDDVIKWINYFRKNGYTGLQALPVITRYSLKRGREIVDEYLSHGFKIIRFKYLGYFGRASELWDEIGYEPEEYLSAWKDVIEYIFELYKRGISIREGMAEIMAKKLFDVTDPGYCELQMPCGAGLNQLAYAPDGSIYTCDEGRMFTEFRLGSVDDKYSSVLKNATLQNMLMSSSGLHNACDNCALKPFCGICPVESYKQQGDIESKIMFDRRHTIHSGMITYLMKRSHTDPVFRKMLVFWAKNPIKEEKIDSL